MERTRKSGPYITLYIPTIGDKPGGFDRLFDLWRVIEGSGGGATVFFDFSRCLFLRPNAVAFIGGLIRLVERRKGRVDVKWSSMRTPVLRTLVANRFANCFNYPMRQSLLKDTIPYREDRDNPKGVMDYLKEEWLGHGGVHVSEALSSVIVGRVWEIYANAFEHGKTPTGVFSCGQHFARYGYIKLAVLDFGVGIPTHVRNFLKLQTMTAADTLRWAFQPGNTTDAKGIGRGLGLDIVKEFIRANDGQLEIYSHEGYASISRDEEMYENRTSHFQGTFFNITLKKDEKHYVLASEVSDAPLF
jgi:signal transduction histidine kinase